MVFLGGSNKHNGLYLTGLIKDFASNSVETGKKKYISFSQRLKSV